MISPISLKAVGGAAAVYLLGQQVQCPFIAIPLIGDAIAMTVAQVGSAAASFGGAIAAGHFAGKRDLQGRDTFVTAPAGVPQYNFDMCAESLSDPAVTVTVTGPVQNNGKQRTITLNFEYCANPFQASKLMACLPTAWSSPTFSTAMLSVAPFPPLVALLAFSTTT
jgi:hypothetical protein